MEASTWGSLTDMHSMGVHSFLLVAVASATALICIAAGVPETPHPTNKRVSVNNPHWKMDGCASCHDMSTGSASPIASEKIDQLCFDCHDGRKAHAELHPTHRRFPSTQEMARPEGWPLSQGELGCITCHDSQFGCDLKRHTRADNPNLLRQSGQGPVQPKAFCANCHLEQSYPKLNPHLMLATDGSPNKAQCLFCHEKAPDPKTLVRTFKPDLKATQAAICLDCHPRHRDPLVQMHIGLRVTPDEQAYMCAVEASGLSKKPPPQAIARFKAAAARPSLLVPAQDGTTVCSTCHNPHEAGVFAADSQLAFGAMSVDRQQKLLSPVREKLWCRRCHAN